jgi:hypothetical protein
MKTRIREATNEQGNTRYICEYLFLFFFWKNCNNKKTNFPKPAYINGYVHRTQAEERIKRFLNGLNR